MGTRGFYGFVIDGVEKIVYNHWDSYPSGLGQSVLEWLRFSVAEGTMESVRASVRDLRMVTNDVPPTPEQIVELKSYADTSVATRDLSDWYVLLRKTQGSPAQTLRAGYAEDAGDFPADSLFAEWGYVVDFDKDVFEVYEGFRTQPHSEGRFADRPPREDTNYVPVALRASWPLDALPESMPDFDEDE